MTSLFPLVKLPFNHLVPLAVRFLPQLVFWHQCSPTQQLMTSLGLPHSFSNAFPPARLLCLLSQPVTLISFPPTSPTILRPLAPTCAGARSLEPPVPRQSPHLPTNVPTGTHVPSPRLLETRGLCRRGVTLIPEVAPSSHWGTFQAWVVCCLSVSDFAAPEAMALSLQAQAQESLGSQQIINNTLVTPPATS